jgi:hypothetical protein
VATEHDTGAQRATGAPQTVHEALGRARLHGRAAAAEALAALRALLDAAALAGSGAPSNASPVLGPAAALLDELAAQLGGEGVLPTSLLAAVAEALDGEIARWERRAREDSDARAVLRAFLGLRELLWELGVRPGGKTGDSGGPPPAGERSRGPRPRPRRPRVQRVRVEG